MCVWDNAVKLFIFLLLFFLLPGMVAEALRADSPLRTRWAGTDHQRLEKTDNSPLSWPCTTTQTVYVAFTISPGSSCVQGSRFPKLSGVCLTSVWKKQTTASTASAPIFTHQINVLKSRGLCKRVRPAWFNPYDCERHACHVKRIYTGLYRAIFLGKTSWRLHICFHCLQTLGPEVSWSGGCG